MRIINNLLKIPRIIRGLGIFNASDRIRALWWNGDVKNNFGDALTPYLIEKISGKKAILCNEFCLKDYYLVTGSVMKYASRNSIVWGAGIINRNEKIKKPKKILAVRGPITRQRLL
jgi:pyruvyltransferase